VVHGLDWEAMRLDTCFTSTNVQILDTFKKKKPKKVVHGLDWEAMQLDSDRNPFRYSRYMLCYQHKRTNTDT
jgi:hypothetical protein